MFALAQIIAASSSYRPITPPPPPSLQFDNLIDILTVVEQIRYQAELKRPGGEAREAREAVVDRVISDLGLAGCRETVIGNPLSRGISGGQAKRVNIALALVAEPDVLFLDEPTSGLDSATSDDIVALVHRIVQRTGITAISTIHSPGEDTFALFDDLLLLVGGRTCYFGAVNGPEHGADAASTPGLTQAGHLHGSLVPHVMVGNARHFFAGLGCRYDEEYSLAEWLVMVTQPAKLGAGKGNGKGKEEEEEEGGPASPGRSVPGGTVKSLGPAIDFAAAYGSSPLCRDLMIALDRVLPPCGGDPLAIPLHGERYETAVSIPSAIATLIKFRSARTFSNPYYWVSRNTDKFIVGFIMFSLYLFAGTKNDPSNIQNIVSLLFMASLSPAFGAVTQLPLLVMTRSLYIREVSDGCYLTITYALWKVVEEFAMCAFSASLFTGTVFFSIGFQVGTRAAGRWRYSPPSTRFSPAGVLPAALLRPSSLFSSIVLFPHLPKHFPGKFRSLLADILHATSLRFRLRLFLRCCGPQSPSG